MDYDYFDNVIVKVIDYDYDYIDFSSNVIDYDYDYNYPMSDTL